MHIHFELVLDRHVHVRRCTFLGRARGYEVRLEWGLCYFADNSSNLALPGSRRRARRTDVQVLTSAGRGSDPDGSGATEVTLRAERCPEHAAGLDDDLRILQLRHDVAVPRGDGGCLVVNEGKVSQNGRRPKTKTMWT